MTQQPQHNMEAYSDKLYTIGSAEVWGHKFWQHPWFARNVLCSDNRRRTVYFKSQGDFYNVRCKYNNQWHNGFLSTFETETELLDLQFIERKQP